MENKDYLQGKKDAFVRALYLVAQHDPQTGYDANPTYWGKTLRTSLIEEEVNSVKALEAIERWNSTPPK